MPGPELNFTARLDTSQFLSQIDQARTQFGLAFGGGGGGGFGGAMLGAPFQTMFAGMQFAGNQMLYGNGGTFTDPNIAYAPHYGAMQAQTSLSQEWLVNQFGLAAAQRLKPPGVSAVDYALGAQKNYIDRQLEASHDANMAGRAGLMSGLGGLAAGSVADFAGYRIGGALGGGLAARFLGEGARGAGSMIGGFALGTMAFNAASDFVSEHIEDHYAKIEQMGGVAREMGELAGGGRGLKRSDRLELGFAAMDAARANKMPFGEMGDILAMARQEGMLPTSTNPGKFKEQAQDFARTIEEGAQILGTSLSTALQVVKAATGGVGGVGGGMSAQEAIVRAAGMGGAEAFLQWNAFGMSGANAARGMGLSGAQGFGMFTGALGAVGGPLNMGGALGMSGEEMRIMGGPMAAAQFLGTTQMGMAKSPLGNLQLMAGMGGQSMGGMSMFDLPGAALGGLGAGGGDFLSNAGKFMVHQNELRRGVGAGGLRTMAHEQIVMGGDLMASLMPGLSSNEAQRLYAQSMGLDPDQAKLLVGGVGRASDMGTGDLAQARSVIAMQGTMLGVSGPVSSRSHDGISLSGAISGGMMGAWATGGNPLGIAAGAIGGFAAQNWHAIGGILSHPGDIFRDPLDVAKRDQREMAAEYEQRLGAAKARLGYTDLDVGATQRFLSSDLRGARLNLDGVSMRAGGMAAGALAAMGVSQVNMGPNSFMSGGLAFQATGVQQAGRMALISKGVTQANLDSTMEFAYSAGFAKDVDKAALHGRLASIEDEYQALTGSGDFNAHFANTWERAKTAANAGATGSALLGNVRSLIEMGAPGATRNRLLGKLGAIGGINDPEVRAFVDQVSGKRHDAIAGAFRAAAGGGAAMKAAEDANISREAVFLNAAFSRSKQEDLGLFETRFGSNSEGRTLSYYKELQSSRHYLDAKEAVLHGNLAEAKKDLQIANMETRIHGGDQFRSIDVGAIDPSAAVLRPGASASSAAALALSQVVSSHGRAGAIAGAMLAGFAGSDVTSFADEVRAEKASGMGDQNKARRKALGGSAAPLEHAVGFGEQETAMHSILQSLKSTQRSLDSLDKRISKMGAQPQGNPASSGAPMSNSGDSSWWHK